jgi:hypothetical protein
VQSSPSDFDLLFVVPASAGQLTEQQFDLMQSPPASVADSEQVFDLLYVAVNPPSPDVAPVEPTGCKCGCNKLECQCGQSNAGKPCKPSLKLVYVGAEWCLPCRGAKKFTIPKLTEAGITVETLDYDHDDKFPGEVKSLPTWFIVSGDVVQESFTGHVHENVILEKYHDVEKRVARPEPSKGTGPILHSELRRDASATASATSLESRIQELAHSAMRPPPVFGKPGDSPKKSPPLNGNGITLSGDASATKSPAKSGLNQTSASTPSPGGRS